MGVGGGESVVEEPASGLACEVGEDHVCTCAVDAGEGFEDHFLFVEPACGGGAADHEVFAADLVGGDGERGGSAEGVDDVEVGAGGFDHEDVGAFCFVEGGFAKGFAGVGWVHLVGFLVTGARCGVESAAEGAVAGAGVFGGVAEDGGVGESVGVESGANGTDAAVHHVAWGDDVCSGAGVGEGLVAEDGDGFVIEDGSVGGDEAVVAVAVVGVESDVGDDGEVREGVFEGADGEGDEAVGVEGFFCARGFEGVVDAREEYDGADAFGEGCGGFGDEAIEGPAVAAWHGGDGFVG